MLTLFTRTCSLVPIKAYMRKLSLSKFKASYLYLKRAVIVFGIMLPFQNCGEFNALDSSQNSSVVAPSFFQCESNDSRTPEASALKRLNKFELKNTIEDILSTYLDESNTSAFMNQLSSYFDDIPNDHADEEMSHFDQSITSQHIDKQILLAERIAELIMGNTSYRDSIIGSCAQNTGDETCRDNFLSDFGKLVYRRPLSSDDLTWFRDVFTGRVESYENLIAALFSSPYFIYHYEVGESDISEDGKEIVSLGPYERASRISYLYLQSMPDAELFEAAANGSIMNNIGLRDQVNRLLSDEKVQSRLTHYLSEQLFKLEETPNYQTNIEAVNTMISSLSTTESLSNRREHMINEVYDFMNYIIWKKRGGFSDLMVSNAVFPRTPDLAEIYGTAVWSGSFNEQDIVRAPASERSGILTRAQLLFTGMRSTQPIIRGARIYNEYLCGELPVPADTGTPSGVVLEDDFSERETITAITQHPGSACIGCHEGVINPLGFPFEMFDSFGRYRSVEDVFHPESSVDKGKVLVTKQVNTNTSINLGDTISSSFNDAISVTEELASNERAVACFSLKLWDFAAKQPYKIGQNDCATTSLYQRLVETESIYEALASIPFQPEFFKRTIQ